MMHIPLDDWTQWTFSILLLGGLLFVGLFNIIIFLIRRRLRVHYYFGMLCIFYVLWYSTRVITIDVFPLNVLSDHHKVIIAAISTNRMALFLSLYTMYTLKINKPSFERVLKLGSNILLLACLFMPLSLVYTENVVWLIELFNVIVQVYFSYEIMKALKTIHKDIRIITVICYFFIFITKFIHFFLL